MTQHISESKLVHIPLPPLDRTWTDADVHKYYKLDQSDIKAIEDRVSTFRSQDLKIK